MSNYTVGELAKLSGVSVRALHHYDSKGLLRPVQKDATTKYRFYGKPEILRLQQILFYKELGFSLDQIKKILNQDAFSLLSSLETQRKMFLEKVAQNKKVVETIDSTITHLKETTKMEDKQFFEGWASDAKNAEYQMFMYGKVDQSVIDQSNQRCKDWTEKKWTSLKQAFIDNGKRTVDAIKSGLKEDCQEVCEIISDHYKIMCNFWPYTKDDYIKVAHLYSSHPDFIRLYGQYHPKLADFLSKAMILWAKKNL